MKFSELYQNRKHKDIIDKHTLFVSNRDEPCIECGKPTRFIDYCGECRFCSEECQNRFWQRLTVSCADFHDNIGLKAVAIAVEDYIDNPSMETLRGIARNLYKSYTRNMQNCVEHNQPTRNPTLFVSRAVTRTSSMKVMNKADFGGYAHKMVDEIVKNASPNEGHYSLVSIKIEELYAQLLVTAHEKFGNGKPMLAVLRYMREDA